MIRGPVPRCNPTKGNAPQTTDVLAVIELKIRLIARKKFTFRAVDFRSGPRRSHEVKGGKPFGRRMEMKRNKVVLLAGLLLATSAGAAGPSKTAGEGKVDASAAFARL